MRLFETVPEVLLSATPHLLVNLNPTKTVMMETPILLEGVVSEAHRFASFCHIVARPSVLTPSYQRFRSVLAS